MSTTNETLNHSSTGATEQNPDYWKNWHEKNKAAYNAQRKSRYHTDEAYRERVKARRRLYAANQPKKDTADAVPEGYSIALSDLAKKHDMHRTTPIRWMMQGHIPKIDKIGTAYYLKEHQQVLLDDFFGKVAGRKRIFGHNDPEIQNAVKHLWNNWRDK